MLNYLIGGAAAVGGLFLLGSGVLFESFLDEYQVQTGDDYVAVKLLSTPAQGGFQRFKAGCAECHGSGGQGTAKGPKLTGIPLTTDHRGREALHRAIGRPIPAHETIHGKNAPNFNDMEMMGKFLREFQVQLSRRDG